LHNSESDSSADYDSEGNEMNGGGGHGLGNLSLDDSGLDFMCNDMNRSGERAEDEEAMA